MYQIGKDVEAMQPIAGESSPTHVETTALSSPTHKEQLSHTSFSDATTSSNGGTDHIPLTNGKRAPCLSVSDLNPPDVQKVMVEHIVRRQDSV